jgi:transposase
MSEDLSLSNERLDDIPVLLAHTRFTGHILDKLQVTALLDKHFPTHGNWQGLSLGMVTSVWLSFILSQANHRLSHVQGWAGERLMSLAMCLGQEVRALDFSDTRFAGHFDRLARVLDHLSNDDNWNEFERSVVPALAGA